MLLQCHQVVDGVDTGMQTGGHQTRQHTGNDGTMFALEEQRVLALANTHLEDAFRQGVVKRGALDR
jgi:hypothetical protein